MRPAPYPRLGRCPARSPMPHTSFAQRAAAQRSTPGPKDPRGPPTRGGRSAAVDRTNAGATGTMIGRLERVGSSGMTDRPDHGLPTAGLGRTPASGGHRRAGDHRERRPLGAARRDRRRGPAGRRPVRERGPAASATGVGRDALRDPRRDPGRRRAARLGPGSRPAGSAAAGARLRDQERMDRHPALHRSPVEREAEIPAALASDTKRVEDVVPIV